MTAQDTTPIAHPAASRFADEFRQGHMSRREFMARVTALGVSAGTACMLGALPATARAASHMQRGGTIRLEAPVRGHKDPRRYDWPEIALITHGTLEYLVEYNSDGSFRGMLLERWEVNENATRITLHVRPGIRWSNGDAFTAQDVARNITRWCERDVEGNSMAERMATLIDPATGKAAEGAITVVDELTVALTPSAPDITLIPGMADYPAAIVHETYDADAPLSELVGTGPMRVESLEVGVGAVIVKSDHPWWGDAALDDGGWFIDRLEVIDLGRDPATWVAAAEAGEIDVLFETVGDFVDIMDRIGWQKSEIPSGGTIVIRPNQTAEDEAGQRVYADKRLRQGLAMAVDNAICLELGYADRGIVAENCHVGPAHPEYDPSVTRVPADPVRALELIREAGMADYPFELISVDDDWERNTADAVAAQLRDAGLTVSQRYLPQSLYSAEWKTFPFSATSWLHRPLGVQILSLAYRSGAAWNESGFSNPTFDALLAEANAIDDVAARREVMGNLQAILIEEGVIIQPYWRALFRHSAPNVIGAEQHISYLPQVYKWALAA